MAENQGMESVTAEVAAARGNESGRWMSRLRRAAVPGLRAAAHGLALTIVSLAVQPLLFCLALVALALTPVLGFGFTLFPLMTELVRRWNNLVRRYAGRQGMEIARPYLRVEGRYGSWRRFRSVTSDPATWRDLAWLLVGSITGPVLGLVAASLPLYALEGLLLIPLILYFTVDWYGYGLFWPLQSPTEALSTVPQALLIGAAGLALAPRLVRLHLLAARALLAPTRQALLRRRVEQLTETRADTVDAQAAELRRIERDLHDGTQARLVSLSISIGLAEQALARDPETAQQLLVEAREASGTALAELRHLVRGIHPPVLAERGLDGAVRALALALPLQVDVETAPAHRLETPVESAAYFAVAEALANVVKHSGARRATVRLSHRDGVLRMAVGDDGVGGADPRRGTGLRGIERRLAAFDGTLAIASPPGGPTVVTMTLPCP